MGKLLRIVKWSSKKFKKVKIKRMCKVKWLKNQKVKVILVFLSLLEIKLEKKEINTDFALKLTEEIN